MVMTLEKPQDGEAAKARECLPSQNASQPLFLHNEAGDFFTVTAGTLVLGTKLKCIFTIDFETGKVDHEGHFSSHKNNLTMAPVG